jgi:arylsulfatase A-like enzyme/predicted Zn-dependent protease
MKKPLIILIIIAGLAVWWFLPSKGTQRRGPVNTNLPDNIDTVILISIDTLRADHLGCYGYKQRTSPNIDQLAKDSLFCKDAFSTIPLTLPAHSSMLSALIPPTHGVHDNLEMYLPKEILTLPEVLKDNGYATYGIVSSVVLSKRFGLDQGFDVFDDAFVVEGAEDITNAEQNGAVTTEHAIKWLTDNRDKKKFMFIHYYDPHTSYTPPEPFSKKFKHRYDGEIAFTDHCIGKVIDKLKSLKLYDDALIVVVGDHGEMLGEHEEPSHSFFVYQNAIRVPLMFKLPKDAYAVDIKEACSIIDIPPTIIALAGIDIPEKMQGIDLLALAKSKIAKSAPGSENPLDKRAVYAESLTPTKYNANSLLSIISGDWHYIQTTKPEIYNRVKDPFETNNLIDKEQKRARVMQFQLKEILDASVMDIDTSLDTDSKTIKALESIGYVRGTVSTDFSFDVSKPNPLDVLGIHNDLSMATHLIFEDKFDEAMAICEKIIKTNPDIPESYRKLASCYAELKLHRKEIELLHILDKLKPDDFEVSKIMAVAYKHDGQTSKAIEYTKKALEQEPDDPELSNFLAGLYVKQGAHGLTIPLFLQKLSRNPGDIETLKCLVAAYDLTYDYPNAAKYCETLLKHLPENSDICGDLAKLYMKSGAPDKAVTYYKQSLVLSPDDINMLKGLADAYKATKDYEHAIETLQIIADLEPENAMVYDRLANEYIAQKEYRKAAQALETRLKLTGKHISSLQKLVSAYTELKEYQLCIDPLKQLLELMPGNVETNYRLAMNYHYLTKYPEALQSCLRTLELDPKHLKAHLCLSQTYLKMNRLKEAIAQYESALKLKPDMLSTHNTIAWLQATQKDPELYNPQSALVHAQKAADLTLDEITGKYTNPRILDTLAAAYAANGRFDDAVETAKKAIAMASSTEQNTLAANIKNRLTLYQNATPYLENSQQTQNTQP